MISPLDRVRHFLDSTCFVRGGLLKKGCRVSMSGMPSTRLVVDLDKEGSPVDPNATRCDFLVFADYGHDSVCIVPLELKRGALDTNVVTRQLQAGAKIAESLIPNGELLKFRPVAATGKRNKFQTQKLKKSEIHFHGCKVPVKLMSCGSSLAGALKSI